MKNNIQIKSKHRVKDFAEVFTNEREVKAMCDLIPQEIWKNIESTFLEPTCGNGNFLVEIYRRKLQYCNNEKDGIKALISIVGIDIQGDNVIESRMRLMEMYVNAFPNASEFAIRYAAEVLRNNIICGDSLEIQKKWIAENEMKNPTVKVGKDGQLSLFE